MFKDIEKTINLVNNPQVDAPNFLLALGLCCYTEYWGRLLAGIATRKGRSITIKAEKIAGATFGSMLRRSTSASSSLKYYCMSCGTQHRQIACPKCGSKMKRVGS